MDKEILDKLIALGVDRPITAYRMVGNRRVEVHCLGDNTPTVYDISVMPGAKSDPRDVEGTTYHILLHTKTVKDLKKIAKKKGIKTSGLRKDDLVEAIVEA